MSVTKKNKNNNITTAEKAKLWKKKRFILMHN